MALEINEGSICWSEAGFAPGRLTFVFDDATFSADQIAWNGDAGYLPNGLGFTASASKDGILQFSFRNGKCPLFLQKIVNSLTTNPK